MTNEETINERFPMDTADHQMTVLLDHGKHRHIQFSRPGSSTYRFNLVTWPGYLAITGDCDDFVFRRLDDMFEFFREKRVNPSYWGEKAVAVSKHGGLSSFSPERYRQAVYSDFQASYPFGEPGKLKAWRDVRWDLLEYNEPSSTSEAINKACGYTDANGNSPFDEFWDHHLDEPSYGFLWACHAIRWGIEQYDLLVAAPQPASNDNAPLSAPAQVGAA